ncbi:hypothetical protein AM499_17800 [Bacillus sp. FJAT-22090]|uniref:hypothetical protein n=1 Tax=Bacillus sp. FJAT-22090 TaxID=1581038 RepID=UPI0006ADFB18|nr:hypothetical protein [Bacillus sp. FJAT-22090]ALC87459.1 hypothetical protein AM499_17800 [Bacillus sp. FJAT-22090]
MNGYVYTKTLGVIVGTMTIIGAIVFGILSFIGMSLSTALNKSNDYSSSDKLAILILMILLLLFGLITGIGSFFLKNKAWKFIYTGLCLTLGFGLIITCLLSFGSIGFKNELFIMFIGIIYLVLGHLASKNK